MASWTSWSEERHVAARLSRFRLLEGLASAAIAEIASHVRCFCLPAGQELLREGRDRQALFFVVSGSFSVMVPDQRGGLESIATISAGETVGEMSLMTDDPPSAALYALRDTEVMALDKAAFDRIIDRHPTLLRNLSVLLVERLRRTTARAVKVHQTRSIALIGGEDGGGRRLARDLVPVLRGMGLAAHVVDESAADEPADWFHYLEASHDMVIYVAPSVGSAWARACERRVDRLVEICCGPGGHWPRPLPHDREPMAALKRRDLVVLCEHAMAERCPSPVLGEGHVRHLIRRGSSSDLERFARYMAGRAIGLVLSGGGARGFAHIGVIRALREHGIAIDAVGGTSMGALIAACVAMEWPEDEIIARLRAAFVTTNPLSDIALPTVAFFRGRKVDDLLAGNFGDRRIESLALPYLCVTSDLTSGVDVAHRAGPLARTVRASIALPGVLPPVTLDGHVHVDGAVMNNIPVEHMTRLTRGGVIAVDVSGDTALLPEPGGRQGPGILSVLVRTGTVGNEWQRREAHRLATCLFEPQVADVGFRDWQAFDRAVARGYDCARRRLETDIGLLRRLGVSWSDAATVDEAASFG